MEYKELFSSTYPEDIEPIVKLLSSYKIDYRIEVGSKDFNPNFAFSSPADVIKLSVREDECDIAKKILVKADLIVDIPEEEGLRLMLGGLNDDELREMIVDATNHSADQVAMAETLLKERGIELQYDQIIEERKEVAVQERQPRSMGWMGKALSVLFTFLFPPVGFAIFMAVLLLKVKDVEGNSYSYYNLYTKIFATVLVIYSTAFLLTFLGLGIIDFSEWPFISLDITN
jgi:hypothetical protein